MKVSELITKLQELKEKHGDLPVHLPCWEVLDLKEVTDAEYLHSVHDSDSICEAHKDAYPLIWLDRN